MQQQVNAIDLPTPIVNAPKPAEARAHHKVSRVGFDVCLLLLLLLFVATAEVQDEMEGSFLSLVILPESLTSQN